MKKIKVFLVCILIFSSSCSKEEENIKPFVKKDLKINLEIKNLGKFSDYYSSIEYLILDTPEENPLVQPYKISIHDGVFFVQDSFQRFLFIFDKVGNQIGQINAVGDGPGQYLYLDDFQIFKDQVWIKDSSKNRFFVYDQTGKFLFEEKALFRFGYFHKTLNYNLFYLNNDPEYKSRFARVDLSGNRKYFLDLDPRISDKLSSSMQGFIPSYTKEETYYNIPFTDEIGVFGKEGNLDKIYQIDFGKYQFTLEDRSKLENFVQEFDYQEANELGSIGSFFPFGNGFLMQASKFNQKSHTIFLDGDFKILDQFHQMENDLDGFPIQNIAWTYDREHIYFLYNSKFFLNIYKRTFSPEKIESKEVQEIGIHSFIASNLEKLEEENTVLIKLKIKSNLFEK